MSFSDLLAVVPARGGSQGIPGKNLRHAGGMSLVARAAEFATALPCVGAAVISSDDPAIIAEAQSHGLDAPFVRPAELATGTALAVDTWRHAWLACEAHYGRRFDVSLFLEPTSPLREPDDVAAVLAALEAPGILAATTVSAVPAHFAPPKVFRRDAEGVLVPSVEDPESVSIRQKLDPYFRRNGLCYAARRDAIVELRSIVGTRCAGVVIDRDVVNIDLPDELALADRLLHQEDTA